jgi:arsenate reductase (thioredoxin)
MIVFAERTTMRKQNVLFLCTGNSARSQIAESLLRKHAGDIFDVYSAGTEPKGVNPLTLRVLGEIGVPTAGLHSKGVKEFLGKLPVRYLIIVCSGADAACPAIWPGMNERLFWPFEDPAAVAGTHEEKLAVFRDIRDQIEAKILDWLAELRTSGALAASHS